MNGQKSRNAQADVTMESQENIILISLKNTDAKSQVKHYSISMNNGINGSE